MRTLLIDNYDSFTYNLFQLIAEVNGVEPIVVHNDASPTDVDLDDFDNIVVSPGPGHPGRARDFGISADVLRDTTLPVLGVCLGHQGIVATEGGTVAPAPTPRHGYLDRVRHTGSDLFAGIPQGFTVVRYHSLSAQEPLPAGIEPVAWTDDGVVMGVRHRSRPQWGVQFHPESIASEFGERLVENFARLTPVRRSRPAVAAPVRIAAPPPSGLRLQIRTLDRAIDAESAFDTLYSESPRAFWLDSEHVTPGIDRFSFLGDASGPLAETITYRVGSGTVQVTDSHGEQSDIGGTVFDYLSERLRERAMPAPNLPFDFACGYVGWFGYELKADCDSPNRHRAETPDAAWLFVDRMIAIDHTGGETYLLALHVAGDADSAAVSQRWLDDTTRRVAAVPDWRNPEPLVRTIDHDDVEALLVRDRDRYLADVDACRAKLRAGESYEICLTDNAVVDAHGDPLDFYRVLRRCNPAPYAAFLRFDDIAVACASPERFLKIDRDRVVESKPIKGTAPRGSSTVEDDRLVHELVSSEKTRAENLIIVDLLRNDLGRVCEIGSVEVPALMATETYATVHQLVSTVRGRVRPELNALDCVRACFPGGSMTGAPKLRTMETTDALETQARGIYSGAIGFLGLDGTADLAIVIRTAVRVGSQWRVGAGGAIVLDSDPDDEFHEMVLKAAATLRATQLGVGDDNTLG
ncbi:MAG: aminodeoxychorismate synthase component I [Rhodococcus fascians]